MRRKKRRQRSAPVFKPYYQHQMMLFPPSLEELIPPNHLVRVVSDVVDRLDISTILTTYKGGGTSSYHPRMLLKVILYAYVEGIYTSRRIAKALRENIHFMWLSGMSYPDFRTINNFRSHRLKEAIDQIFASLLLFLHEKGYVKLDYYFVDGTVMRANANRYSHVWKKNAQRYQKAVLEKIIGILAQIDEANAEEERRYGHRDLPELGNDIECSEEELHRQVEELNKFISSQGSTRVQDCGDRDKEPPSDSPNKEDSLPAKSQKERAAERRQQRLIKKLNRELLPRFEKYQRQLKILGNRNSYSKTDPDATFYRSKDGPLLPGYNLLMGSENQFILNYSVHQNFTDNVCFVSHMQKFFQLTGKKVKGVVGDAGFGTEANYHYLERKGITAYLRYPGLGKRRGRSKIRRCLSSDFQYDEAQDVYICSQGRKLYFVEERHQLTATGYSRRSRVYRSESCEGCALRDRDDPRRFEISPQLERYRQRVQQLYKSQEGKQLFSRRKVEIETIFGHFKHNKKFRRFLLRGLDKVNIELGLMSIAHNIARIFNIQQHSVASA